MTTPIHKISSPRHQTLETLLGQYTSPLELARYIDQAMLYQVLYLNYEPEHVKLMIPVYETLWELRNLILNQSQS